MGRKGDEVYGFHKINGSFQFDQDDGSKRAGRISHLPAMLLSGHSTINTVIFDLRRGETKTEPQWTPKQGSQNLVLEVPPPRRGKSVKKSRCLSDDVFLRNENRPHTIEFSGIAKKISNPHLIPRST